MALWSIEGQLTAKEIPKPSAETSTTGISNVKEGQTGGYVYTKDAQILVNDGTNNRILIGFLPDGTYGMVISKAGTDVLTVF